MPRGGPRANAGRPIDPDALRRDRASDKASWTHLPPRREGRSPMWPLSPGATPREAEVWAAEWRRPQAVMWEQLHLEVEVALYVRTLVRSEDHRAPGWALTHLRQQQEALGLSLPGMMRLRWVIDPEQSAEEKPANDHDDDRPATSARDRFRSIKGGIAS